MSSGHMANAGALEPGANFTFSFSHSTPLYPALPPRTNHPLSCSILQGVLACIIANWCLLQLELGADRTIEMLWL